MQARDSPCKSLSANSATCFHHKSPSAAPLQMAKDVTTFLAWAAEPEMDERKLVSASLAPSLSYSTH